MVDGFEPRVTALTNEAAGRMLGRSILGRRSLERRVGDQILISDDEQENGHGRDSEGWTPPCEPSRRFPNLRRNAACCGGTG